MKAPPALKSAGNCLIAVGFIYLLIAGLVLVLGDYPPPDLLGKIFMGGMLGYGSLLWLAAFLLYRCSPVGKWIWWVCCPLVLVSFPVGTVLGMVVFTNLNKEEARAALAGKGAPR